MLWVNFHWIFKLFFPRTLRRFGALRLCCLSFVVLFTFASSGVRVCARGVRVCARCVCISFSFLLPFASHVISPRFCANVEFVFLFVFCLTFYLIFDSRFFRIFIPFLYTLPARFAGCFVLILLPAFCLFWQHFYIWQVAKVSLIYLYSPRRRRRRRRVRPIVCAI